MADAPLTAQTQPTRDSWSRPSRFKEHLSLASVYDSYTAHEHPTEVSRFSPDTPHPLESVDFRSTHAPVPPHAVEPAPAPAYRPAATLSIFSGSSTFRAFSPPPAKYRDLEHGDKDKEHMQQHAQTPRTATTFRDRMSRRFFDFRYGGSGRHSPSLFELPIQRPAPPPWEPLNIHKKNAFSQDTRVCTCHTHAHEEQKKQEGSARKWRRRLLILVLILLLLWLAGNVAALNTRVFPLSTPDAPAGAKAPSAWAALTPEEQSCLTQYTLNAPSTPTLYPCGQCLPRVSTIKVNDSAIRQTAADATMFCGVRALWEDADAAGQAALEAVGWVQDAKFCAWGGVQCNGSGQVSSIQLVAPAIPASIPAQISSLVGLETFQIIGNNTTPSGPLPASFASLNLTTLHLESTALEGSLPDSLGGLTTLTLVHNANLTGALPDSVARGALTSLIVNNEALTLDATQLAAFCSGALQTCDLRGTGIASCGACTVG